MSAFSLLVGSSSQFPCSDKHQLISIYAKRTKTNVIQKKPNLHLPCNSDNTLTCSLSKDMSKSFTIQKQGKYNCSLRSGVAMYI